MTKLEKLISKKFCDENYLENIKKVKALDISSMQVGDIKTYLTFIFRGERFCEGHIAMHLNNGVLLELLKRAVELKTSITLDIYHDTIKSAFEFARNTKDLACCMRHLGACFRAKGFMILGFAFFSLSLTHDKSSIAKEFIYNEIMAEAQDRAARGEKESIEFLSAVAKNKKLAFNTLNDAKTALDLVDMFDPELLQYTEHVILSEAL